MTFTADIAEKIIQDYANILEHSAPAPGCVADIKELPHSKPDIKDAIAVALAHTEDSNTREQLKVAYMCLADWQEGVGDNHIGIDYSRLDMTGGPQEAAQQLVSSKPQNMDKWNGLVMAEMEQLQGEFKLLDIVSSETPTNSDRIATSSSDIADLPGYDAAASAASKAGAFWFFVTFIYLLFSADISPELFGGTGYAIVGMFTVSILIAAPLFLINLKLALSPWFFKLTCGPAVVAATWYSYHWLFSG